MQDSLKGFTDGVHKVRAPGDTVRWALEALRRTERPVLSHYYAIEHSCGIPHYRVRGTGVYRSRVGTPGASGKGHTHDQALASGLMELIERWSCFGHLLAGHDAVFAPRRELEGRSLSLEEIRRTMSPERRPILDAIDLDGQPLAWFRGRRLNDAPVWLPTRFMSRLHEGTNGMTAGNSFEEAVLHGILEVVERHCQTVVRTQGPETPLIDPATIDDEAGRRMLDALAAEGAPVLLRDASLGTGVPVLAAVRRLDDDRCQVTFGSATTRNEALLRAVSENVQTEGLMNCYRPHEVPAMLAPWPMVEFAACADIDDENIRVEIDRVEGMLADRGMEVLVLDTTSDDVGVPTAIVTIPGAIFALDDVAAQTPHLAVAFDAMNAERWDVADESLRRARADGLASAVLADHVELLVRLRRGQTERMRALLAESTRDCTALTDSQRDDVTRARGVVRGLSSLVDEDHDAALSAFADLAASDPAWSLDYLAVARRAFDDETWAAGRRMHDRLRTISRLRSIGDPRELIAVYQRAAADQDRVDASLLLAEQEVAAGRLDRARAAIDHAFAVNDLAAELSFGYLTAARVSTALGERERALEELERLRALAPHDQRVRALVELLGASSIGAR